MVCRDESEDRRTPAAGAIHDFRALDHKQFKVSLLIYFLEFVVAPVARGVGCFF